MHDYDEIPKLPLEISKIYFKKVEMCLKCHARFKSQHSRLSFVRAKKERTFTLLALRYICDNIVQKHTISSKANRKVEMSST